MSAQAAGLEMSSCFAVVADPSARVLILGSLPGTMSLRQQQYYAKPQNAFWRIMGAIAGAGPDLPYEVRLGRLIQSGIALWDVCASAHRPGSLDSAIKHHAANDFEHFYAGHPRIELVCFNGQKAADLYRRSVHDRLSPELQRLPTITLPSTSPAHAGMPYAQKLSQWSRALRRAVTIHNGSALAGERSSTTGSS